MKATIDFDERLYRRLKVEAARQGRTIRDLVDEAVRSVLGLPVAGAEPTSSGDWIGSLGNYAGNARGRHDLQSMRESIARGRSAGE
jgi:hypothetical protein